MKILLGDFSTKGRKENIFKPIGNDNGVSSSELCHIKKSY
jgi:hypothetical protein